MIKRRWLALLAGAAVVGVYQAFVAPLMPAAENVLVAWIPQAIMAGGAIASSLINKNSGGGGTEYGTADFENWRIQRGLPRALRSDRPWMAEGGELWQGMQNIGDLMARPGQLSPTVSDAIRPRLAMQSEATAQNFRGIGAQQQGMAARSNAPMSIKNALSSALDVAQERAQRDTRRGALADSDQLRRQDLSQVYNVLNSLLQFSSSIRGTGAQTGIAQGQIDQRNSASNMAMLGSLMQGMNQGGGTTPQSVPGGGGGSFQQMFPAGGQFNSGYG